MQLDCLPVDRERMARQTVSRVDAALGAPAGSFAVFVT
jgi:hypothetical protein